MEQKIELIISKLDKLDLIETEILNFKTEFNDFKQNWGVISEECTVLKNIINDQQITINKLEREIKKKNLIVSGIAETETEMDKSDLEKIIIDVINDKLGENCSSQDIEEVYRLGLKKAEYTRPIRVVFNSIKTKSSIWSKRKNLQNTNIYINEDLTTEQQKQRSELLKMRKELKKEGKEAKLKGNKLLVEGIHFKRARDSHSSEDSPAKPAPKSLKTLNKNNEVRGPFFRTGKGNK